MIHIKSVLFPTDFSECSQEALKHAIRICKNFDAKLHILHVNVMSGGNPDRISEGFPKLEELIDQYERQAVMRIEEFRRLTNEHVVVFSESVVRGFSVAEEIIRFESGKSIDLIVMGTHGRGMLSHFVMGSVAEKVVRYSSCPVITVNESGRSIDIVKDYRRILVPLDFSEHSRAGLKYAIAFARLFTAHIDVLHCFERFHPPLIYNYGAEDMLAFNPEIKRRSEETIAETVREIDPDFERFTPVVVDGKPNREIVSHADNNDVDLICLSTRGLGTVQSFFIGSTADKVIRRSKRPVLAVKEHERSFLEEKKQPD